MSKLIPVSLFLGSFWLFSAKPANIDIRHADGEFNTTKRLDTLFPELSVGNPQNMFRYFEVKEGQAVSRETIRQMIALWRKYSPDSSTKWLSITPDNQHFELQMQLCYAVDPSLLLNSLLVGSTQWNDLQIDKVFRMLKEHNPTWLSQNISELITGYPGQLVVIEELAQQSSSEPIFTKLKAILATPDYAKKDNNGRVAELLKSVLNQNDATLFSNKEGLANLVAACARSDRNNNESGYKTAVYFARMLFRPNTADQAGTYEIAPLKLAALAASRLDTSDSDRILSDVLVFAQPLPASALEFLKSSSAFKDPPPLIYATPELREYLGKCLRDEKSVQNTIQNLQSFDELLEESFIPKGQYSLLHKSILSELSFDISPEQLAMLPEHWQRTALQVDFKRAAANSITTLLERAATFSGRYDANDLLSIASEHGLQPFSANATNVSQTIPEHSLDGMVLAQFVNDGSAQFAMQYPNLIKEGSNGIERLFQAWAFKDPYNCSVYLSSIKPSVERNLAIQGMLNSLRNHDPDAAAIWELELH